MGSTFGRGGATTFQQDLRNADCIVIEGSNMAECHPVGFQWVMEAKRRGATIIHVDPRFTRTSAVADIFAPIRAGTDIVFLGALIRHTIENDLYFRDYVMNYTNAPALVTPDFQDTEELDGLFSGWNHEKAEYDISCWNFDGAETHAPGKDPSTFTGQAWSEYGTKTKPRRFDYTLQHERCVFQILRRHFARYTPEMVEEVCGIAPEMFARIAEAITRNSGRERTTAFVYSVGWTQHSVGVQYIRAAAILQLLLGNIGRPGGGIMALRGHASIQGSTDIPTLFDMMPGYLPMPKASRSPTWEKYLEDNTGHSGWWTEFPKYAVSLMKAWYGEHATKENGFAYDRLPLLTGDHSHMTTVSNMADGKVKGYFVMGENPTNGSMNGGLQRQALRKLDWLVVRDLAMIETAEFWKPGEVAAEEVATEVFFFPAAAHTEKSGTFTNTQRLLQWHEKAVEPQGHCRSELSFMYGLGQRLQRLYADSPLERDLAITKLTWNYTVPGAAEDPDPEAVLKEINGFSIADQKPLSSFTEWKDDGSTAGGCWIYSGSYASAKNMAARRKPAGEQDWVAPEWGWAWPANRRILYNRASADPDGKPWSEKKRYVWWDEEKREWTGYDVPDFLKDRPPSYRPPADAKGTATIGGADPFILLGDGKGWLYVPSGLKDGPLPTHYEPQESAVRNALYAQQCNPSRMEWHRAGNPYHRPFEDPEFPYVLTTYRLTEHHTTGAMSRWVAWLSELQPELFCEISPELAELKGIRNGQWATITTARAEIELRALVTERVRPLKIRRRVLHQIGVPYHWGANGLVKGDAVNDLLAFTGDPNVSIQESKALTCNIEAGRRGRGRRAAISGSLALHEPAAEVAKLRDTPEARKDE